MTPTQAHIDDIPEELFRQMTSCQTAANEFLRQFWSATYPPLGDLPNLATATPAQRATKAAKMIGYLSKTHEKVHAIVWTAQQQGLDATRVELVRMVIFLSRLLLNIIARPCNLSSMLLTVL